MHRIHRGATLFLKNRGRYKGTAGEKHRERQTNTFRTFLMKHELKEEILDLSFKGAIIVSGWSLK